jgi:hypothetical protein
MSEPGQTTALDSLDLIRSGPSPIHVTAELVRRLRAGGFSAQAEGDTQVATVGKQYLVWDGTVVAWAPATRSAGHHAGTDHCRAYAPPDWAGPVVHATIADGELDVPVAMAREQGALR